MNSVKTCPKCNTENPLPANFCRHCRYRFPKGTKDGTMLSPKLLKFTILEDYYTFGSIIHIEWGVENASIVTINDQDVTSSFNIIEYRVDKAEFLTLTAENDYDKTEETIRLSPKPLPTINSFTASSSSIRFGQTVKLKWDICDCQKVVLLSSGKEIDVSHMYYINVNPNTSEQYVLRCYAKDENVYVEKEIYVEVIYPVVIKSFISDKDVVVESDKVTLKWEIENATSIMLYPIMKDVTKLRQCEVNPSRTTEYKIVASNNISQEESSLSVGIRLLPKINIDFADSFSKIKIQSVNVDYSILSPKIKEIDIDRWMISKSVTNIKLFVWKYTFTTRIKSLFKKKAVS